MESPQFDTTMRKLQMHSGRRGTLGLLLGSALGLLRLESGDAKGKKKRKKKRKKPQAPQSPPAPPASPPPPSVPVARADASCIVTNPAGNGAGAAQVAQTFAAIRTGQLTSASIQLRVNGAGMDFDIEIWTVDENDLPDTFIAGTVITNVPATGFPGPRQLTATFPSPAPVVSGTRYAIVITKGDNADFNVSSTNPCTDGRYLSRGELDASWFPEATVDLHFETVVVA
jgi:hypothetical protein